MGGWAESLEGAEGEEALLQNGHAGETGGGESLPLAWTAWVDDRHFPDAAQFFQHAVDAERLAFPRQFTLPQGSEQQGRHAVEGMHLDFRAGPVKHWAPFQEVRVGCAT